MKRSFKFNWILGVESLTPLLRLWGKYASDSIENETSGPLPEVNRTFKNLRLRSLGLNLKNNKLGDVATPGLLIDSDSLDQIDQKFTEADGISFGKEFSVNIESKIFTKIAQEVPGAENLTESSFTFLEKISPWTSTLLQQTTAWIVPIYHEKYGRAFRRGFSHIDYLGCIFTTYAERKFQPEELQAMILAVDLAHEIGHQMLMLYQLADPILISDLDTPVYSSIRRCDRPAILALHACVATAYMLDAYQGTLARPAATDLQRTFAKNSILELTNHQSVCLDSLSKSIKFTSLGGKIFDELRAQLADFREFEIAKELTPSNLSYFGLLEP